MDINIFTFKITDYILGYDNFSSLDEFQLDEKSPFYKKLITVNERQSHHLLELLPGINFFDADMKLVSYKIFINQLKPKLATLGKKEAEDYIDVFRKDLSRIIKLYKRIKKSSL